MEDTLYLMEDLACAFYQIVHSFPLIESIIYTNNLWNISHQLESVMYHIVCSYEQNDINSLMFNLDNFLIPIFESWYRELSITFNPHILS